jgi:hypothetical protein
MSDISHEQEIEKNGNLLGAYVAYRHNDAQRFGYRGLEVIVGWFTAFEEFNSYDSVGMRYRKVYFVPLFEFR